MAEQQITGLGARTAPLNRTTKDSELFQLLAVRATFDGTGAAGSFVPTVEIVSDSGRLVGTFPLAASLAVGESADVTFAPFLRSGIGQQGIYYDFGNSGDWLVVDATGTAPSPPASGAGYGIDIVALSAGLNLEGSGIDIRGDDDINVFADHAFDMQVNDASDWIFNNNLQVDVDSFYVGAASEIGLNPTRLGFFFALPVVQQPTPVTLADVIALLQAYGLAA